MWGSKLLYAQVESHMLFTLCICDLIVRPQDNQSRVSIGDQLYFLSFTFPLHSSPSLPITLTFTFTLSISISIFISIITPCLRVIVRCPLQLLEGVSNLLYALAYRSLQLPRDAPFELKLSPGKGWGAFATKRIERGSLILKERALLVVKDSSPDVMEVSIFDAFFQLSPDERTQFNLLLNSKQFTSLLNMLAENSFSADVPPAHGLFPLCSRFNHSCIPNARSPTARADVTELYATKDIEAGEEIYFCYHPDLKSNTRPERQAYLGFVCNCKACLPGTSFQQLSDIRRRMIRGLQYILRGVDLDGKRQISQSPIITDPKLKAAAKTHGIPVASRLVLHLLRVFLLEEEGLLDDWEVKILEPGVVNPIFLFQSEHNRRIGKLALSQDTWLKKLQVVFGLYGRKDPADLAVFPTF